MEEYEKYLGGEIKVYYAHCMSIYGTPQEERDMATLKAMFPEDTHVVVNPAVPYFVSGILHAAGQPSDRIMQAFFEYVSKEIDIFAFRALPTGNISCGVMKELRAAEMADIPIIELPSCVSRRGIGLEETREYLRECGQR